VRRLAEEVLWIFQDKKIHREALASLAVFCEAARRDVATVELAQRTMARFKEAQRGADQEALTSPGTPEGGRERAEREEA
jgi:hypothetical protein